MSELPAGGIRRSCSWLSLCVVLGVYLGPGLALAYSKPEPPLAELPHAEPPAAGDGGEEGRPMAGASREPAAVAAEVPDAAEQKQRLVSLWEERRGDIVTARLSFLDACVSPEPERPLSVGGFQSLVARYDLVSQPDDLPAFLREITERLPNRTPLVKTSEYYWHGDRIRWTKPPFDSLVDRDLEFHFDGDNNQINVVPRQKSYRFVTVLDDLRFVPTWSAEMLRVVARGAGTSTIELDSLVAEVDDETGLVLHLRRMRPETQQVLAEEWEQGLVLYPGGIPFPTVSIRARFRDGWAQNIFIRVVKAAEFNVDLEPEAFQMAATPRTKILDQRGEALRSQHLEQPTGDLRSVLPPADLSVRGPAPFAARDAGGGTSLARWLLGLNGILLLSLAIYLWRSSRRPAPGNYRLDMQDPV